MGRQLLAALLGAALGWACVTDPFHCENDQQCVEDGVTGQCQGNQYCTFPDDDCESGQRYAESAGGGLGGTCLPVDEAMDTDAAGDGTAGAGGSAGSDGPGDSTAGMGDGTGESGRSTTEDSGPVDTSVGDDDDDDDSAPPDDYPPCVNIDECDSPSHTCLEPDLEEVCAPPCVSFEDCPVPAGASIVPVCTDETSSFPGVCILPCRVNGDCPDPLDCVEDDIGLYGGGEICAWD